MWRIGRMGGYRDGEGRGRKGGGGKRERKREGGGKGWGLGGGKQSVPVLTPPPMDHLLHGMPS